MKGPSKNIDFNDFIDAETVFDDVTSENIKFEDVGKNQMEFVTKLSITLLIKELIIGGHKSDNELRETENHTKCYKSREEATKFCHEFFK